MDVIPQLLGRLSRRNTIKELGSVQEPPKCAYDAGLGGGGKFVPKPGTAQTSALLAAAAARRGMGCPFNLLPQLV